MHDSHNVNIIKEIIYYMTQQSMTTINFVKETRSSRKFKTSSSAVAKRPRNASCMSVVIVQ